MYTVGQQICNGQLAVVSVDSSGNITGVAPVDKDAYGVPLTFAITPGVTEDFLMNVVAKLLAGTAP